MKTPSSRLADTEAGFDPEDGLLAPSHALALRLASQGRGEREIARALDIPVEAVEPLLEVARAKLARIVRIGLVALFAALAPQLVRAAVIEVTTLVDQDGGPACSLRNAIVAANQNAPSGGCPAGDGDDTDRTRGPDRADRTRRGAARRSPATARAR